MAKSLAAPFTLPMTRIDPSPTNPRKSFDSHGLEELASSIREAGVLMPILVRPIGDRFEIVAGERRWRASGIAGLDEIPCAVREMDDDEVLRAQLVENLQRADVAPLEEAAGFRALLDRGLYDLAGIASRIGKGEGYVRSRLVIHDLQGLARRAMEAGLLTISHAAIIAPLAPEDQDAATECVIGTQRDEEVRQTNYNIATVSNLRDWVRRSLTPSLETAPFDKADPTLNPAMGACDGCAFRTINTLFSEPGDEDRCLKRPCFQIKVATNLERVKASAPEGTLLVSTKYSEAPKDALRYTDWTALKPKDDVDRSDDEILGWADDEAGQAEEIRIDPETFDALYVAITRNPEYEEQLSEEDVAAMEEAHKTREDDHAAGTIRFVGATFVRDPAGLRWPTLDEQEDALPENVRMAILVDGSESGKTIPVVIASSATAAVQKQTNPEAAKEGERAERLARKETLRLQRAEMIARRRALTEAIAEIDGMATESLDAFAKAHVLDFAAIGAVKLARQESNVWDSKDPENGRHPGKGAVTDVLGLAAYRYNVSAKDPDERAFLRPLRDVVKALVLGATSDEIHVGDGYAGESGRTQAFALFRLCGILGVDLVAIRAQADWDTLSKAQRAEREKERERKASEASVSVMASEARGKALRLTTEITERLEIVDGRAFASLPTLKTIGEANQSQAFSKSTKSKPAKISRLFRIGDRLWVCIGSASRGETFIEVDLMEAIPRTLWSGPDPVNQRQGGYRTILFVCGGAEFVCGDEITLRKTELKETEDNRPETPAFAPDPRLDDVEDVSRWACGYGQRVEPGGTVHLDDATYERMIDREAEGHPARRDELAVARQKGQVKLWGRIFESSPDGATWPGLAKEVA